MEVGVKEEKEGVLSCGERRRLGLWPPSMVSRSSRGEARAARRGECARVVLTAARRSRREQQRARWSRRLALRDPRASAGRAAPSVKAAAPYGEAAFAGALDFAGCGEGDDRRPSSSSHPLGRDPAGQARPSRADGKLPRARLCHHSGRAPGGRPTPGPRAGGSGAGLPARHASPGRLRRDGHGAIATGRRARGRIAAHSSPPRSRLRGRGQGWE